MMFDDEANRISFDLENYNNDEDALFADVAKTLQILTRNGEICTFEYEDCGIYILQHNYESMEFGDKYPHWLNLEEYETFQQAWAEKAYSSTTEKPE